MHWQEPAKRDKPLITIPAGTASRFAAEIRRNPMVEVGGKYIGFIRGGQNKYATLAERHSALSHLTFEVTDYLDDGPNATRTRGFHRGDARWQMQEFRRLEEQWPDLEQLGSWHSHHPNGSDELSFGDITGYLATVNDRDHNHDFFFASLGVDMDGFATAKHYLLIRDDPSVFAIPADLIELTGDASMSSDETSEEGILSGELRLPGWTDTVQSRKFLARERECLHDPAFQDMRLRLADGDRLVASGNMHVEGGIASVALLYPSAPGRHDGWLKIETRTQPEFQIMVPGKFCGGLEQAASAAQEFLDCCRSIRSIGRGEKVGESIVSKSWQAVRKSGRS